MSRHTYPWHTWPGRAVVGLAGLAASVWRDWWPRKTCGTCRYCQEPDAADHCDYNRRPVPDEYTCKHWKPRKD